MHLPVTRSPDYRHMGLWKGLIAHCLAWQLLKISVIGTSIFMMAYTCRTSVLNELGAHPLLIMFGSFPADGILVFPLLLHLYKSINILRTHLETAYKRPGLHPREPYMTGNTWETL